MRNSLNKSISFCLTGLVTAGAMSSCTNKATADRTKPNIVIIYADDQGFGDVGCYGGKGYTTPNLDQMAAHGMRFTNFYVSQAVCSASRSAILTGCHSVRISIKGALFPSSTNGIGADEVTIAEMLKEKGYSTGIIGKWHLGHLKQFLPLQNGFDEYYGLPYSNDMWPYNYDGTPRHYTKEQVDSKPWLKEYPQLPIIEGNEKVGEVRNFDDQDKLTTTYTEKAVDFITRHKASPFFLYVPQSMCHVPLGVSNKFKGKSEQGMYGDVMMELDWSVGQILKALDDNGIRKNTLVIYTSDNGPWLNFGNNAGTTAGLREGKGTSWEGGQREPCIMQWPGVIPEGKICNKLSSTIDLFPTIANIVGASLPNHKIDGVNILSLLKGDETATPRKTFYYYWIDNLEAVRTGYWKLVLPHSYRTYTKNVPGNDGLYGEMSRDSTGLALYNLRRDPGERYDVKELYPEKVQELQVIAEQAREDLGDALTNRKGKNVRDCGHAVVKE